jgi:hypothetical protein
LCLVTQNRTTNFYQSLSIHFSSTRMRHLSGHAWSP